MNKITENRKAINERNEQFRKLHRQLLDLKLWDLANDLSNVYHEVQGLNYKDGMDFITELNKKY